MYTYLTYSNNEKVFIESEYSVQEIRGKRFFMDKVEYVVSDVVSVPQCDGMIYIEEYKKLPY